MDTDTLIYIFFIVVSIIASISKSRSKKKNKKPIIPDIIQDEFPSFDRQEPYDPFEEVEPFINEPKIQENITKANRGKTFSYDDEYSDVDENYDEEIIEENERKKDSVVVEKQVEHILEEEPDETEFDFDPVKAIVYTEILKRPEY